MIRPLPDREKMMDFSQPELEYTGQDCLAAFWCGFLSSVVLTAAVTIWITGALAHPAPKLDPQLAKNQQFMERLQRATFENTQRLIDREVLLPKAPSEKR